MRFALLYTLALALLWGTPPTRSAAQAPAAPAVDAAAAENAEATPPPPPATATLLIAVNTDDAEVRVDGTVVGQSPLAPFELSMGRHVVQVSRPGFRSSSRSLDLSATGGRADFSLELDPTQATALEPEPEPEPEDIAAPSQDWYRRWYVWAGAGGALLLGAVIIGVAASSGGGGRSGYPLPPIQP